jgi:competence protein ComEA
MPSVRPVPDLDRRRVVLLVVVCAVAGVVGVRQLGARGAPARAPAALPISPAAGAPSGSPRVTVHVAGAVRAPGVYRLARGARVDDAVRLAGGALRRADLTAVNLAAEVEDGRQVLVPLRAAAGAGVAPGAGAAPGPGAAPAKVNLNTADAAALDVLPGVGPATAAKILAFREEHGSFASVDELGDVPGIGDVRLEALRELVTV